MVAKCEWKERQKISIDPDQDNEGNVEFVNAVYETDYFPLPLIFVLAYLVN